MYHELRAAPENCQWGYFDNSQQPVLRVKSGDIVFLECLTHHAGDAPDLLMDEGVREVYRAFPTPDREPGVHIVTGPIAVQDAEPGDVLECRFLRAEPRLPYGSNFQANWGLLYSRSSLESYSRRVEDLEQQEHVTIYRVDWMRGVASALFQYAYPTRPQKPYPGVIISPDSVNRVSVSHSARVPLRPHIGIAGVAPAETGRINTIPPGLFGGNIDNRGFGPGTSMFYPVMIPGGFFWAGDTHFAEGDGEISGTAMEASLNCTVQLIVHKDLDISAPVLETKSEIHAHGFHEDLNEAVRFAAVEMIHLLENRWKLSHQESYSLLSVAGDVRVTQVVNGVRGTHIVIRKDFL
jgi:acetamidase/formamidase